MAVVEIPKDRLEPETLRRLIEEYVSREGTDYGQRDYSLDQKIADVMKQIDGGEAVIVYDPDSESCNIVTREQLQ
ncbi:MAG: YheU family protein [Myxococcales bacterium]|nr:YheU family protein [Myxococcales bacterium]